MMKKTTPYTEAASVFHLLSHPARLHILDELRRGAACVCHLQAVLKRPQAYVSQQLRVLREAEAVVDEKDGLNVYYHIADANVAHLVEALLGPAKPPRRVPGCPCPKCSEDRVDVCCD